MPREYKGTYKESIAWGRDVYTTGKTNQGDNLCTVPKELRAPEQQINLLVRFWHKFRVSIPEVTKRTGIKTHRLYNILYKRGFASIAEALLIEQALVDIVMERRQKRIKAE